MEAAIKEMGEDGLLEPEWQLCIHHYVGSAAARTTIETRAAQAREFLACKTWAQSVHFSFGTVLPDDLPIDKVPERYASFIELTRTHYDPIIRTPHTDVGKVEHLGLGYGGCALPLILDHNTPNNSVALLWAETDGGERDGGVQAPAMRPLFRRRQRHA